MVETKEVYAYIAAPSRSGSTILAILLDTHPRITSVGELRPAYVPGRPGRPTCSCGKEIEECDFWRKVEHILQSSRQSYFQSHSDLDWSSLWSRIEFYPLSSRPLDRARKRLFAFFSDKRAMAHHWSALHLSVAQAAMQAQATQIFVDGSKQFYFLSHLATSPKTRELFHFRVIHLVRDVRGVVASMIRHVEPLERLRAVKRIADYWVRNHRVVERLCQNDLAPSEYLLVHYGRLCKDPCKELRRISDFFCIEYDFKIRDIQKTDYHVHGNRVRKVGLSDIQEDHRWEQELSVQEVELIERVAGALNRKYHEMAYV